MDETYDCVILGTGLKECILSGVLSCEGLKVLHMDRNKYYGGDCASLNLNQLFQKFNKTPRDDLGPSREYNVDLIPKFLMSNGALVSILVKTEVTRYLDFKTVEGSFVLQDGKIHKVPSNVKEATTSSLLGLMEKNRYKNFMQYIQDYKDEDPKTHKGLDLKKMKASDLYKHFNLSENTINFTGHAVALEPNDDYKESTSAYELLKKVELYAESVFRYGNSPYIYPMYGLGDMPQAFARLSAIHGGTYMLDKKLDELVRDENGVVVGVKSEGEVAKCKFVIADPSYFPDKVKKVGEVIRCICLLSAPPAGLPPKGSPGLLGSGFFSSGSTEKYSTAQIILPQHQLKRKNDIYISLLSHDFAVVPKGKYVAFVSTIKETNNPEEEIKPGLVQLGKIDEQFLLVDPLYEPIGDGKNEKLYISKSYDPSTHFKDTCADIMDIYERIMGKPLDLTPPKKDKTEDE
jgi:Rab GDP dissociation inhibitor